MRLAFVTLAALLVSSACDPSPDSLGACCNGTECSLVSETQCGGSFVGGVCGPNPCAEGGCCAVSGECSLTTGPDCDEEFLGPGSTCNRCRFRGVCCAEDDTCTVVPIAQECEGTLVAGSTCEPNPCKPPPPQPTACCNGTNCSVRTPEACEAAGGASQPFTSCDNNPCDRSGACCRNDGTCDEVETPACDGLFLPDPLGPPACLPNTCNGACCDADSRCSIGSLADCGGGAFLGPLTSCDPDPCEDPVGACCEEVDVCVERLRTECDKLFLANLTCNPDPCPVELSAEVTELCAGVTHGQGVSSLSWSFAVASTVSLSGQTLTLGVEGPLSSFMAAGVVRDDGGVRIENVEIDVFGTYGYEVLSVGNAVLAGDLSGNILVDDAEQSCPDAAASPFFDCTEQPPGSVACECDPFADMCSGSLNCSINFFVDEQALTIESMPALDGSDCCPASECISDFIQTVGAGGSCNIVLTGTLRRDDCLPGLFCDPDSEEICVPLCINDSDCADSSCELFSLGNPGFGPLGRCSIP